jgi:hypothetical protein
MPRNITVHFSDGTAHQYNNAPDDFTPDQVEARTKRDYPNKKIVRIDGGKKSTQASELDQVKKNTNVTNDSKYISIANEAKESIKDRLIDDESARFKKICVFENGKVHGLVNAKNRSGGYVGWTAFEYNATSKEERMFSRGTGIGDILAAISVDFVEKMYSEGKHPKTGEPVVYKF